MSKYVVHLGYREYTFTQKAEAMVFAEMGFTHQDDKSNRVCIDIIETEDEVDDGTVPDVIEVEEVEEVEA